MAEIKFLDLPDQIIIQIMNFLSALDAVTLSFVCKQLLSSKLWKSITCLDFNYENYRLQRESLDHNVTISNFVYFVDRVLSLRSEFTVDKFGISFHTTIPILMLKRVEERVGEWISYAVVRNAKHMKIIVDGYDFRLGIFNDTAVSYLHLCCGQISDSLNTNLRLNNIKVMYLHDLVVTDEMLKELIISCTEIERLLVSQCNGLHRPKICSTSLKKLALRDCKGKSLDIYCPNLSGLWLSNVYYDHCCIQQSPSLSAYLKFELYENDLEYGSYQILSWFRLLSSISFVTRLSTANYFGQYENENDDEKDDFKGLVFENLNHLELDTGLTSCDLLGMEKLFELCPNISKLTLKCNLERNDNFLSRKSIPVQFSIPKLKILELKNSNGESSIKENVESFKDFLALMRKHGTSLEEVIVWGNNSLAESQRRCTFAVSSSSNLKGMADAGEDKVSKEVAAASSSDELGNSQTFLHSHTEKDIVARTGRQHQRYEDNLRLVSGCIPFKRVKDADGELKNTLEVLMISSPGRNDLVFPKGGWDKEETVEEAACRLSLEKAGVQGVLKGNKLGVWEFRSKSSQDLSTAEGGCRGFMFALEVTEELDVWPKKENRSRKWVLAREAFNLCRSEWMRAALDVLLQVMTEEVATKRVTPGTTNIEQVGDSVSETEEGNVAPIVPGDASNFDQ